MPEGEFWTRTTDELTAALGSGVDGLTPDEAARRLVQYGRNRAAAPDRPPAWRRFAGRFANPLVMILLFASALSAATGDVASFVIVGSIVLLSVLLDFAQETRAQNAVDALQAKVALRARVRRGGAEIVVPVAELVPGDVVQLRAGDLVPGDGRLLAARDFFVNEALLTGESYPVEKHAVAAPPAAADITQAEAAAMAGTSVVSGSATLLIAATGRHTALGQLAGSLIAPPPPTAFDVGLRRFSMLLLRVTVVLVILVLTESLWFQRGWLESLMFALALAVGLTPELLPMIVTVTLAHGAVRLARSRAIVKHLPAIHDLGAMDVLCTDKTGTLTEASIHMVRATDAAGAENPAVFELAWLNSYFETGLKNPLDEAILAHATQDGAAWRKLDEVPFDFERRRVSVLVEREGGRLLIVKGAPEDVLRLSAATGVPGGETTPLDATRRAALVDAFDRIGMEGCRALGVAFRAVGAEHVEIRDEADLVFAGFVVFLDPPKASAGAAIHRLERDGVAVKIITGDNEHVATALCAQLGVKVTGMVTGSALAALSEEALRARLRRTNLFCRMTPQQKLRVILALKASGKTVGYLGDGINDAPSLHAADVGVSVDSAADVAKAAADIVLLEQDLAVLHDGVIEGRRTVINVNKYILMASSANFGNILSMVLAGLFLPFLPLLPIQVLLTNLLYDVAQAGLPVDRVDDEALVRPIHWDLRLIERFMLVMGPISTLFDVVTFAVLLLIFHMAEAQFRTGWFIESLVTQTLMIFAVRTRRRLFESRPHRVVTLLAFGISGLTLALPFLPVGEWFEFVTLGWAYYAYLAAATLGFLVAVEAVKRVFFARMLGKHGGQGRAVPLRAAR
ncbi:MAG: magnesium-translocating P-type ATPase [Rhodopila sp.]|nr:magnesium-translocating P-type ATPase [Rhodopila sp.]